MSWTNIPNGNLAIGAPIRSIDQLALRDNPIAIAEGATGAPRVRAEALNGGQSGTAPIYAARAWVNFDGTTAPAGIRASGNVSSVSRDATGTYTINFTTAIIDTNFNAVFGQLSSSANPATQFVEDISRTTTSITIKTRRGGSDDNAQLVSVTIFR
jgi:hypothetical protein